MWDHAKCWVASFSSLNYFELRFKNLGSVSDHSSVDRCSGCKILIKCLVADIIWILTVIYILSQGFLWWYHIKVLFMKSCLIWFESNSFEWYISRFNDFTMNLSLQCLINCLVMLIFENITFTLQDINVTKPWVYGVVEVEFVVYSS